MIVHQTDCDLDDDCTCPVSIQGEAIYPRYTVGSLTGRAHDRSRPSSTWYVYDRFFNFSQVSRHNGLGAQLRAETSAHLRNRGYLKWLRQQGIEVRQ